MLITETPCPCQIIYISIADDELHRVISESKIQEDTNSEP